MFTYTVRIGDRKWLLVRVWLDAICTWDCSCYESKELLEEIAWCVN